MGFLGILEIIFKKELSNGILGRFTSQLKAEILQKEALVQATALPVVPPTQ